MTPRAFRCVLAGSFLLSATACASPPPDLWPPSPDQPTHTVLVTVDAWHAVIALPRDARTEGPGLRTETGHPGSEPQSTAPSTQDAARSTQHALYEEWGYAEQGWYLEGRRGVSGVIRALFWPTAGVVEVARFDRTWAERTPDQPADVFTFEISHEGYRRLRRHLLGTIASRTPVYVAGAATFFPASRSYHLFHQCHQYAALALREAGLPVSPAWAPTRGLFAAQLSRAERLARASRP